MVFWHSQITEWAFGDLKTVLRNKGWLLFKPLKIDFVT